MIPFVRTRWELEACLDAIDASPLGRQRGLHRWVMAEVPSIVYRIPEYAAMGVDGVSIGSNDLTQLMLGVDRSPPTWSASASTRSRSIPMPPNGPDVSSPTPSDDCCSTQRGGDLFSDEQPDQVIPD
jgi:hypothetical protein